MKGIVLFLIFILVVALALWSAISEKTSRPMKREDPDDLEKIYLDNKWWR